MQPLSELPRGHGDPDIADARGMKTGPKRELEASKEASSHGAAPLRRSPAPLPCAAPRRRPCLGAAYQSVQSRKVNMYSPINPSTHW